MSPAKAMIIAAILYARPVVLLGVDICNGDPDCLVFENLSDRLEYGTIIERMSIGRKYSEGAQYYIGMAYAGLAAEEQDFDQRVAWYAKSLEYGYFASYLDLFRLYRTTDPARALSFLYEYETKKPKDGDFFYTLGMIEFQNGDFSKASAHLLKAKNLLDSHPSELDWVLFKSTYFSGGYARASEILNAILKNALLSDADLLELKTDTRFAGLEDRREFQSLAESLGKRSK